MFRYRCPHCSQLLQALEIRAGKTTICAKCSKSLTIPAEQEKWLNERGESLLGSSTVVMPAAEPEYVGAGSVESESDVFGAIALGANDVREVRPPGENQKEFLSPGSGGPHSDAKTTTSAGMETPGKPISPQATATATEDRRRRLVVTRPAPTPRATETASKGVSTVTPPPKVREQESISFEEPLRLVSQLDIADQLAGRLSSRMKPPPEPPRDIRPTTAIWMISTGIAIALLVTALLTSNDFLSAVVAIGISQIVFGALWIIWIAYHREPKRGFLAILPPVNIWFMTQYKYAKLRPLRFAATGVLLIAASFASGFALPVTRGWAGATGRTPTTIPDNDVSKQSKLIQLRTYRDQPDINRLLAVLTDLAKTDELKSEDARDRPEISHDLKELTTHRDSGVRVKALEAYTRWGGDDARTVSLKFLDSPNREEREAAIRMLPRWKDPETARAIAQQIGRSTSETTAAIKSLQEIGGTLAEDALIPQLEVDDAKVRVLVMDLLASSEIGGPTALAKLRQLADNPPPNSKAFEDIATRQEADRKAKLLASRLKK